MWSSLWPPAEIMYAARSYCFTLNPVVPSEQSKRRLIFNLMSNTSALFIISDSNLLRGKALQLSSYMHFIILHLQREYSVLVGVWINTWTRRGGIISLEQTLIKHILEWMAKKSIYFWILDTFCTHGDAFCASERHLLHSNSVPSTAEFT